MTNDDKNAGTRPAGKQADLDKRIAQIEQTLTGVQRAQTEKFDQLDKVRAGEAKQISELGEAIKAGTEARERADKEAKKTSDANSKKLQTLEESHAAMAQAIADMAAAQAGQGEAAALRDQVIEQLVSAYAASQQRQAEMEQQSIQHTAALTAMHGLLEILIQDINTGHTSLSDAVSAGISKLSGVVNGHTAIVEAVSGKIDTQAGVNNARFSALDQGVSGLGGQLSQVGEDGRKTRASVAIMGRNISRILQVVNLIQREVEGLGDFMVKTSAALETVATKRWTLRLQKALKNDILREIKKLPDSLRHSVADILKAANQIKVEAENFAAANAHQLTRLQGEVQSLISYFSGEGNGVIKLLRDHTMAFETGIQTALGRAEINADSRMELIYQETERRVNRLVSSLKEGDFGSLMESFKSTHDKVVLVMEQLDKAFQELKEFEDNSKSEIRAQVDIVRTGVLTLGGEVHNMRKDVAGTASSVTATREYLGDLYEDAKRYRTALDDIQVAVRKILNSDADGRHEFFNVLLEKLAGLVGQEVKIHNQALVDEIGISRVMNEIQASDNEE